MIPWAHPSPHPKDISIGSAIGAVHHRMSLYSTMGRPFSPQNCPFPWRSRPHLIHPSPQPKRHLDRVSRFCRAHYCDKHTDRQTDQRYSVDNNRPHLHTYSTAIRPNNNNNNVTIMKMDDIRRGCPSTIVCRSLQQTNSNTTH